MNMTKLWGVVAALTLGVGMVPAQGADSTRVFNIRSQSTEMALTEFGVATGLQVLFSTKLTAERTSPALTGEFTERQALDRLLANSGLTYEFVNERTVRIAPARTDAQTTSLFRDKKQIEGVTLAQTAPDMQKVLSQEQQSIEGASTTDTRNQSDEIVVTGTHIRGVENRTAPVVVIDREAIDRSGYSSVQQLIDSLPQNFGGGASGASEDAILGPNGALNMTAASGVNLRGLGTTSTLVLLDGRRVAAAVYGQSVDVSLIPLAAIERVEVLMDGSSAVYGSDAVAGVVNFVLRKDYEGAQSRVRYGAVTEGSMEEVLASQAFGRNWQGGNVLASAQYRRRDNLSTDERPFSATAPTPTDLLPHLNEYSVLLKADQDFAVRWNVFGEALYSNKETERSYTSSSRSEFTWGYSDQINGAVGLTFTPADQWRVEAVTSYSNLKEKDPTLMTPVSAGFDNGDPRQRRQSQVLNVDVKADGALFAVPGGELRAAFGGFRREEDFKNFQAVGAVDVQYKRSVQGAFAELHLPIVGQPNARRGLHELTLSTALRHDDYSDFGGTTNPRVGLLWSAFVGLGLRASYSTSFRAPSPSERHFAAFAPPGIYPWEFAAPGGGNTPVFLLAGAASIPRPETSTNLTFGIDYAPQFIRGLELSLSYYDIDFTDRIVLPPFDTGALLRPEIYGSLITSFADEAAAQAFLAQQLAAGATLDDFFGLGTVGVRNAYNLRQQNAASVKQNGFDLLARYAFEHDNDEYTLEANATVINEILTAFTADSTAGDTVDTYGNPLSLRLRATAGWTRGNLGLSLSGNYSSDYRDISVVPNQTIDSWVTADFNARYTFAAVEGLSLSFSALNVFDEGPPRTGSLGLTGAGYDTANADPMGRFLSLELRKTW